MLATPPLFTAEDLLRLQPSNGRSELIAGRMLVREPAGYEHGRTAARLLVALGSHVARHRLGDVLAAETGFTLRRNPDTVRAPDVAFLASARRPLATTCGFAEGAPDLVAEVRSPGDREAALQAKVNDWLAAGARLVWVLDPATRTAMAYAAGEPPVAVPASGVLDGGDVVPGFAVRLATLLD